MSNLSEDVKNLFEGSNLVDGFGLLSNQQVEVVSAMLTFSVNNYYVVQDEQLYTEEDIADAIREVETINARRAKEYERLTEMEKEYSRDSVQYSEVRAEVEKSHLELVKQLKILRTHPSLSARTVLSMPEKKKSGILPKTICMILGDLKLRDQGTSAQLYNLLRLLHVRELVSVYDEEIAGLEDVELRNKMIEKKNLSLYAFPEVEGWYLGIDFLDREELVNNKSDYNPRLMELTGTFGARYYAYMNRVMESAGKSFQNIFVDSTYVENETDEYFNSLLFGAFLRLTSDAKADEMIGNAKLNVQFGSEKMMRKISKICGKNNIEGNEE